MVILCLIDKNLFLNTFDVRLDYLYESSHCKTGFKSCLNAKGKTVVELNGTLILVTSRVSIY